jgi:hypothetical protein
MKGQLETPPTSAKATAGKHVVSYDFNRLQGLPPKVA